MGLEELRHLLITGIGHFFLLEQGKILKYDSAS